MISKMRISLGQMDVHIGRTQQNLAKVEELASSAKAAGSDLLVLPELWSSGYDLVHAKDQAHLPDRGVFAETAQLARQYNLHVVGSCLSKLSPGKYGNTAVLFDGEGTALASYTKIHLFPLMAEDRYLTAGDQIVCAETAWGRIGLAICYDLRFPELFRSLALMGARIIILPSEWPKPRINHWRTLLRARAIENQLFIAACNRVGRSGNYDFFGCSAIIDPWGEVLVEGDDGEALLTMEIDLALVEEVRRKIPVFADRRPDLY